ncbi:MAG TPA: SDR family oxidoreductase, partial [Thermodesulfobacteriota bacterium]|nr:SDR family oxidoreductase [Thermodesulfobacteriota bacterium]
GGGRGLGEAICRLLAEAGAAVLVADIDRERAGAVARAIAAAGGAARPLPLDVAQEADVEAAVGQAREAFGRLDVLVNNAGVDVTVPVDELAVADWDRILAVNLRGPFLLARAAFPVMRRQRRGQIVNVVSTAAKRAWGHAAAYHASKWGLLGFSHALHVEGRPYGIKVTAVVAGGMRTPFLLERFPQIDVATLQDPRNVAEVIRFVLTLPEETVVPEVMVLPVRETSWP